MEKAKKGSGWIENPADQTREKRLLGRIYSFDETFRIETIERTIYRVPAKEEDAEELQPVSRELVVRPLQEITYSGEFRCLMNAAKTRELDIFTETILRKGLAAKDSYWNHFRYFAKWLREQQEHLTFDAIKKYLVFLNGKKIKANTNISYRTALRNRLKRFCCRNLAEEGILEAFFQKMQEDSSTKKPLAYVDESIDGKYLSPEEYKKLTDPTVISIFPYQARKHIRKWQVLVKALWQSGARIGEFCGEHKTDENGHWVFTDPAEMKNCFPSKQSEWNAVGIRIVGKGRKPGTVYIKKQTFEEIKKFWPCKKYLFETGRGNPISENQFERRIASMGKRILGYSIHPHMFRHSRGTEVYKKTKDLMAVKTVLRHRYTKTSEIYTHMDYAAPLSWSEDD